MKPLFLIPRPGSVVIACLWLATIATTARTPALVAQGSDAKTLKNPVAVNAKSIEAGRRSYARWCAACHGIGAKGDGPKPPEGSKPANLTDDQWDHGSTEGEIFVAIRDGIGPKFDMDSWNSRLPAQEIWSIVNYIRSLNPKTAQTP